jgi:isopentenyldiphosphate isomerase
MINKKIPLVTNKGVIIGMEKNKIVHKKGLLHKGFTLVCTYKSFYILQMRKHEVFDKTIDATLSSHPYQSNSKVKREIQSVLSSLKREWIVKDAISAQDIFVLGSFIYKAKSDNFTEHELVTFYSVELKSIPLPKNEYSHGMLLVPKKNLYSLRTVLPIAPWVRKALSLKLL